MANLDDLANRLEAKAAQIDKAASVVATKVAMSIIDTLIQRTPVDTTAALSNWQVTLDSPYSSFRDPYVPGYLGYTAAASGREVRMAALAALEKKKPGQTIYITNNAPYIRALNSGTSKQDPGGFVEAAVLIARKYMPKLELQG